MPEKEELSLGTRLLEKKHQIERVEENLKIEKEVTS